MLLSQYTGSSFFFLHQHPILSSLASISFSSLASDTFFISFRYYLPLLSLVNGVVLLDLALAAELVLVWLDKDGEGV